MVGLVGDVAIVTGAGRRLGRTHALGLAAAGARVVVNDLDARVADRVVGEIGAAGGTAVACVASVSDPDGASRLVDVASDRFGSVDIVVNNAGFMRNGYLEDIDRSMLDEVLAVNIGGSFHVSRAAWPLMKQRGHGRIVMTSSAGGMFSMSAAANYAAAKAGVYGLTKALAIEGRSCGIGVNAILPHANPLPDDNDALDDEESVQWNEENWGTPAVDDYLVPSFLELLDRRDPSLITPLVLYLASRSCTVTGEAFAAGMGRFSRVFVGEGPGWRRGDDGPPTVADIAANIDAIRATEGGIVPWDLTEEHAFLGRLDR
jgi:NAD(P)-dependent dehydrogenase (short-subunit alcohol dehydrogenase family)